MPDLQDFTVTVTPRGVIVAGRLSESNARGRTVKTRDGLGSHVYELFFPAVWAVLTDGQRLAICELIAPTLMRIISERIDQDNDGGAAVKARLKTDVDVERAR